MPHVKLNSDPSERSAQDLKGPGPSLKGPGPSLKGPGPRLKGPGPSLKGPGPRHSFERRRKALWPGGGPLVSAVGFGAARIGLDPSFSAIGCFDALKHALELGVNLIDCSAQAQDAQSEILVGRALRHVFAENTVKREDLVLVTKVGQLAGHSFEKHLHAEMQGLAEKWTYHYSEGRAVCFSRALVREQIMASLLHLGVDSLDCVLFECPEAFFMAHPRTVAKCEVRQFFHEALTQAFSELGECVQRGLIKSFGVSCATLGYPEAVWNHVSLAELLNAAQESGTREHFRVVAMPFNWIEVVPLAGRLIESIAAEGLGLLVQRPLNAMCRGRLLRLSRPRFSEADIAAMSLGEQKGLENWVNLSLDLEAMGRKIIEVPGFDEAPLSQMVISTLAAVPEVSAVLLGMRRKSYVEDALEALTLPKLLNGKDLLLEIHNQLEFEPG